MSRPRKVPSTGRAFGYVRVSSDRQANEGHSLGAQVRKVEDYATYKGLAFTEMFCDSAVSASKLRLGQREAGSRLMLALKPGDHVIVAMLDRAWRNASDALGMIQAWQEQGITLHVLNMNMDTSTPLGKLFFTMLAAFAEWEAAILSERTIAGMEQAERSGVHTNTAPDGLKHGPDGALVPDIERLPTAISLMTLRRELVPVPERLAMLAVAGMTTPTGLPFDEKRLKDATARAWSVQALLWAAADKVRLAVNVSNDAHPRLKISMLGAGSHRPGLDIE